MTDFDANEDPLRLSASANEESPEPAKLRPRFSPRARQLAYGQCYRRSPRRIAATLDSQCMRAARRACSPEKRTALLGSSRRRRHLWTTCHGQIPGSPS
jgi:hypothetical protein